MSYIVTKTIKGRQYRYEQTSYREGGKVKTKSVYLGPVSGTTRKAADEKYRQVLRDSVFLYGTSRPAERYAREARAREQYHYDLGFKVTPEERLRQVTSDFWFGIDSKRETNFEKRHREYTLIHPSTASRVAERFSKLREEIQKEEARIAAQDALGHAQAAPAKNFSVDDEIEAREAKFEATLDEYNATTGSEPLTDAPADTSPSGPLASDAPSDSSVPG